MENKMRKPKEMDWSKMLTPDGTREDQLSGRLSPDERVGLAIEYCSLHPQGPITKEELAGECRAAAEYEAERKIAEWAPNLDITNSQVASAVDSLAKRLYARNSRVTEVLK